MSDDLLKLLLAFIGGSVVSYLLQLYVAYFVRPKLQLITCGNAGLLVRTPGAWMTPNQAPIPENFIYLRALVKNNGRQSAHECVAYVSKLIWVDQAGIEKVFSDRDLVEMKWSWRGHGSVDIPRDAYQYIDLFEIWKSNLGNRFSSDRFPGYLQNWGAGGGQMYIFLKICCDNAPPATGFFRFNWDGTWDGVQIIE